MGGCTALKYVILPSGITSVGSDVFRECSVFEAIYFKGDAQAWDALDKSNAGDVFNEAMVYFFEPDAPQQDGNYWHYDGDEKTPLVWNKDN